MKLFNESLTNRFYTLERNIKSKSNSFYDSYLDLLEATLKYFLDENEMGYDDAKTCGYLVKEESIKAFLVDTLKLDDYTYAKLPNYIKKCNDHKHKKEKWLQVEGVINFLKVYFDFVNYYLDYIKAVRIEFNAEYFTSIFGETERLNAEYKNEVLKLKDELKESYENNKLSEPDIEQYKLLLSDKDIELLNLDEQNQQLQAQISILKDIKLNSMEEKLNKTIDLLNNLTQSVIENRAVSIAIGESIIGQDITESSYMEKATESIKKKNKSVIGTLENQQQILGLLDNKFKNVSCDDLLFLAEKSRDIKDFSTAQEYYKGVLSLNPKNWKAFFYSSALTAYIPNFDADFTFYLLNRRRLYFATLELLERFDPIENDYLSCLDMFQSDIDTISSNLLQNKKRYIEGKCRIIYDFQYVVNQVFTIAKNHNSEKNMKNSANLLIDYLNNMKIEIDSSISNDDFKEICNYSDNKYLFKYKTYTVKD